MAVDLKAELTRPLALILTVFATLGWVLFALSSWSAASTQKAQRLRIVEITEKRDAASAELARQVQSAGALADLQAKVAAAQDDLTRVSQTKSDVQADLSIAQKNLSNTRRDLSEADRIRQSQKLADTQANADVALPTVDEQPEPQVSRSSRGGRRWSRRRHRSYRTVSRSR